jgi:hypothetical protein
VHADLALDLALVDQGTGSSRGRSRRGGPKPPRGCNSQKTQSRAVELDEKIEAGL